MWPVSSAVLHRRLTHSSTSPTLSRGRLHSMYRINLNFSSSSISLPSMLRNSKPFTHQSFTLSSVPPSYKTKVLVLIALGPVLYVPYTLFISDGHKFGSLRKHLSSSYSSVYVKPPPKTYSVFKKVFLPFIASPWNPSSPNPPTQLLKIIQTYPSRTNWTALAKW